jgi:hypothetical protein
MTMLRVRDEMDVDTLREGTIVINALASPVPSVLALVARMLRSGRVTVAALMDEAIAARFGPPPAPGDDDPACDEAVISDAESRVMIALNCAAYM